MTVAKELAALRAELGELVAHRDEPTGELARLREVYRGKPVPFLRERCAYVFTPQQEAVAATFEGNPRTAVLSANGVGKTDLAAGIAVHEAVCHGALVVVVCPTDRQAGIFMRAVERLYYRGNLPGELYARGYKAGGAAGGEIVVFSTADAGRLTGWHHPRLVLVIEEGQAVPAFVWEYVGALTSGAENKALAIGNPGPPTGPWYSIHTKPTSTWARVHLSALDHPNVVLGEEVVPGAVTRRAVETVAADYGEDSPHYKRIVLGEFADDDDTVLCPGAWLREAVERWQGWKGGTFTAGSDYIGLALDPARFGADATVLGIRQGKVLRELRWWRKADTMETTGRVMATLEELVREGTPRNRIEVTVDEPGLGGGVIDRLREQRVNVVAFNGGKPARDAAHFVNLRAESYWGLRRRLERGDVALPPDELLHEELTSTLWNIRSDGRTELEPKDDLRQRIGRSPDRADAVAMAFAELQRFYIV